LDTAGCDTPEWLVSSETLPIAHPAFAVRRLLHSRLAAIQKNIGKSMN
jgi:hypothetical protein